MKKLLITLILVSPFSFADWGDVYYCQMTSYSNVTIEGKRTDYRLETFQFKLDKTKKAMVFESSGYFKGEVNTLRPDKSMLLKETWVSDGEFSVSFFREGKFIDANVGPVSSTTITANCDKF